MPFDAELLFVPLPRPTLHMLNPCNCKELLKRIGVEQTRALSGMKEASSMDFTLLPEIIEQKALQLQSLKGESLHEVVVFAGVTEEHDMLQALLQALGVSKQSWRVADLQTTDLDAHETWTIDLYGHTTIEPLELDFLKEHTSRHFVLTFYGLSKAPFLLGGWLSDCIVAVYGRKRVVE